MSDSAHAVHTVSRSTDDAMDTDENVSNLKRSYEEAVESAVSATNSTASSDGAHSTSAGAVTEKHKRRRSGRTEEALAAGRTTVASSSTSTAVVTSASLPASTVASLGSGTNIGSSSAASSTLAPPTAATSMGVLPVVPAYASSEFDHSLGGNRAPAFNLSPPGPELTQANRNSILGMPVSAGSSNAGVMVPFARQSDAMPPSRSTIERMPNGSAGTMRSYSLPSTVSR
jgi:hypothetical protein